MNGWANDVTFDFTSAENRDLITWNGTGAASPGSTVNGTVSGVTFNTSKGNVNTSNNYVQVFANANDFTISVATGVITAFTITCTGNGDSNYGPQKFSGTGYTGGDQKTGTWSGSAGSITLTNSAQVRITKIEVTYNPSAPSKVATPSISGTTPFYPNTEVTITCSTNGATIQYSLDDGANWTNYSDPFALTATTTVKAKATKTSMTDSDIATKTFTKETPLTNIAALTAETTTGTKYVTLTNAVVTYVNGKYAFIQDASGAVVYYANSHTLVAGNTLTGVATVTYQPNNSNPQITALSGVTPATGSAPSPTSVAQSAWTYTFANVLNQYFEITGATITKTGTNYYVELNGDNVQLYKRGSALGDLNLSRKYTITGFPMLYNTTKELQIFVEPVEEATSDPLIDASNLTIEFDATSGEIPYDIVNPTEASLSIKGTTGDWISNVAVDVTNKKVTFDATANTGAQRTGTITLSYTGADDKVITITQKPYIIATIPFAFDGGKTELEAAVGFTQSGLGSDYDNSPKLKFDGTGDYVILRINESGRLDYNIKGNSFSGGTFKVQTSNDGNTYSDLATYTSLSATSTESFNLDSDVRYIKWIYTNKSDGNVALGNIVVTRVPVVPEPEEPVVSGTTITLNTTTNMAGWRTYNNNTTKKYTVDGTTKVYYASATTDNKVTLTEIAGGVPANTAVILHQTNGTSITLTETSNAITAPGTSNKLAISTAGQNLGTVYRLGYKSSDGIGFYSYTTSIAPAGIIYVSSITAGARDFLGFDFGDEATGVNEVKTQKVDGEYYNLAGQRVAQPTKGLYIVNGKKVIMK
jgi:hypothetical protein